MTLKKINQFKIVLKKERERMKKLKCLTFLQHTYKQFASDMHGPSPSKGQNTAKMSSKMK